MHISFSRTIIPFLVLFFTVSSCYSQAWKRNRKELIGSIGATNFLGELGGQNKTASPFIIDLEPSMTRPATAIGYRYALSPYTKIRGAVSWGILRGDDQLTNEPWRQNRNLHFRTHTVEVSGVYEIYFNQEQGGNRYNIPGARGMRAKSTTFYAFGGFGLFYFNPQAMYNGKWVSLQPLGTEGQGLPGRKPKYSRINIALPAGVGLRYAIDKYWKIGLELGYRKTFTDYIDDVSTDYYNNDILRAERGSVAAEIADPNKGIFPYQLDENGKSNHGIQRGNPKTMDSYIFGLVSINYTIQKKMSRTKF